MKKNQQLHLLLLAESTFLLSIILLTTVRSPQSMHEIIDHKTALPRVASDHDFLYNISTKSLLYSYNPYGVAVNMSGHVYIVDQVIHCVRVYDSVGAYQYTIGTGWGAGNYQFIYPWGVAINGSGDLYVADSNNDRVQVFDKAGIYQYTIGTGEHKLDNPAGIAVNGSGHVYVADTNNNCVQVFDKAGIYQYTLGTGPGSGEYQFSNPQGVAVMNNSGYVYVVDTGNNRVQIFDKTGIYQDTIGTGSGNGDYQFSSPRGIAVNNSGHIFVADTDNHRVQVFDIAKTYQYTIGVTGEDGTDNAHFKNPRWIAVNATGGIFVSDYSNYRVQVFGLIRAPSGVSIQINGGAADSTTPAVTLTLTAIDATLMCFSNNGTTYTNWETYGPIKAWVLDSGLGLKTVYSKVKNNIYEVGPVQSSINITLPPTGLVISINGGASETDTPRVTLTLAATGATQMCFSNDGMSWSPWEPFAASKTWALAEGSGIKTVYFKARNGTIEAGALATYTITYKSLNDDWWVIPAIVALIIGIIVAISAYARTRHNKVERFWATNLEKLTDVINIQHLLVIHKDSGTTILSQNMRTKKVDTDLISGFLTALTSFQSEIAMEKQDPTGKRGFSLDYANFKIFVEDGLYIRAALILGSDASETLKGKLVSYIDQYEQRFHKELKNWKGNLKAVEGGPDLIEQVFEISLALPHILNPDVILQELSGIAQFIFKIAQKFTENQSSFLLATLLESVSARSKESKNRIWSVIYEMKRKHILKQAT